MIVDPYRFPATDPFWNQVIALLPLDGSNGSTSITDVKGNTWTLSNAASISTAQSKFGGSSLYFDGASQVIKYSHNAFNIYPATPYVYDSATDACMARANQAETWWYGNDLDRITSAAPSAGQCNYNTGAPAIGYTSQVQSSGGSVQCSNGSLFTFASGDDLTVEFWMYATSSNVCAILGIANYNTSLQWNFQIETSNRLAVMGNASSLITGNNAFALNTWHHVAWSRKSGVSNLYVDGVCKVSGTVTTTTGSGLQMALGIAGNSNVNYVYSGYLDNVRITKGAGRYEGSTVGVKYFEPPSAPFPIIT